VHLRRALLLFALVLGLTALAASIAPPPKEEKATTPTRPPAATTPGAGRQASLSFRAPVEGKAPPVRRAAPGAHLTVAVSSAAPGQAAIPLLGRTASVSADTPARFDLVAPEPGRYAVVFTSTAGEPSHVGTIVTAR
jgi:hypothetical protein